MVASSPVPSSWQAESLPNSPTPWIPHLMAYGMDSGPPASPTSQSFPSTTDNVFRTSNTRTSTTLDRDEEKEKWIPTASFIRPFEYNEWEEWDGESGMCTTEGSLGGYGGGDEESRISHYVHSPRFGQVEPRTAGTRVTIQGSRRGTVTSTKGSDQLGTFDFDALPAFQGVASPTAVPAAQKKPRYRARDASPPPINDETNLTDADRQGGTLRTWLVAVVRRTQGRCAAAKGVMKDVLSRSVAEVSRENGDGSAYRDLPEMKSGQRKPSVAVPNTPTTGTMLRPQSYPHLSVANVKGTLDTKPAKVESWRARWRRVLSVPAFRSPLTKILSPVVTRAQWEVVTRSAILAFVTSFIVVALFVAVPVP